MRLSEYIDKVTSLADEDMLNYHGVVSRRPPKRDDWDSSHEMSSEGRIKPRIEPYDPEVLAQEMLIAPEMFVPHSAIPDEYKLYREVGIGQPAQVEEARADSQCFSLPLRMSMF